MKISVDGRERTLAKLLKAFQGDFRFPVEIVSKQLELGDIIISTDAGEELLIMERKQLSDLAASIRDGRYNEQSYRLNGTSLHNHNIIYLIEGNISHYSGKYSRVAPGTLYVAMFGLQYFKGFSVFRTFDITESAEYILRIADKLRREEGKYGFYHPMHTTEPISYVKVAHRTKKKNITPENIGKIILSQIPGISTILSEAILERYGSLYQLLVALEKDPTCLDKITYTTSTGKVRRVTKTSIQNIAQYLLHQKSNIIKIKT